MMAAISVVSGMTEISAWSVFVFDTVSGGILRQSCDGGLGGHPQVFFPPHVLSKPIILKDGNLK